MYEYTEDGYTIEVFDAGYLDWGCRITKGDKILLDNPCYLSTETYGSSPPEDFNSDGDWIPWGEEEWKVELKSILEEFLSSHELETEEEMSLHDKYVQAILDCQTAVQNLPRARVTLNVHLDPDMTEDLAFRILNTLELAPTLKSRGESTWVEPEEYQDSVVPVFFLGGV